MKVLLTGASGFIGRYVLHALKCGGINTVTVGRHPSSGNVSFIEADLLNTADFQPLLNEAKASHLLHLAWYVEHGKYWASPLNLRWVEATTRLVEAFSASGGRHVVVAGTCAEYDWSYGYCREDSTPLVPATFYGTTKDAARRLVMAVCAQQQVSCAWGRIFLPYGTGEAAVRLIPSLIEVFKGTREPFGVNAGVYRDFLHVSDIADAFVTLLQCGAQGTYNISSGEPVRLAEVVRLLAHQLGGDPQRVLHLTSEHYAAPFLLVGENLKLRGLDWRPRWSLFEGLQQVVTET